MTDEPGAQPAETSLTGGPGAALPARLQALVGSFTPVPWSPEIYGLTDPLGADRPSPRAVRPPEAPRDILFIAWRDLANRRAGGSEVLVDRLASGMLARGHRVTLLCGGPVAERPYRVVRNGGTYSQFLRAPLAYLRNFRSADLVVEVCNGMPYLSPLWCRRPVLCLVNHVHTDLWSIRFRPPVSTVGRNIERVVMPRVHRRNLFLTVSESTAGALQDMGVGRDRIRQICNGVEEPDPPAPRSPEPLFLAMGRLTDYKRLDLLLRLWERVRHVTGGQLVIAGDGPERPRLEALAGPGVVFTGRVSEQEKHRLLCAAWMLMHPALIEGWGIVVAEAAIRGTPAVAFDVPGLRDSVVHGQTGVLVQTEGQFASAWASLAINERQREQFGRAARTRALRLHWSAAVEGFAAVAGEAIKRGRSQPCPLARRPEAAQRTRSGSSTRLRGSRSARARTGPGARPGCWPGCCVVPPARPWSSTWGAVTARPSRSRPGRTPGTGSPGSTGPPERCGRPGPSA
jgi:glycosyltransferase involved in cell wall biosynthesis